MKKIQIIMVAIIGCMSLLAACGNNGAVINSDKPYKVEVTNIQNDKTTVTVNGESKVKATPDKADLHFGVSSEATTASEAQDKNTEETNKVIEALKGIGIDEKDIQTENIDLYPRYDYSDDVQKIYGYEASVSITVSNVDIANVGELIKKCTDAGLNEFNSLDYKCSTYDELYAQALADATNDAKNKAEIIAKSQGKEVGDLVTVTEGYKNDQYMITKSLNEKSALVNEAVSDTMDVMPGEVEIDANITVVYSLK